jgi:hypothetical protein
LLVERNAWGQQAHCVAEFQKFDGKSKADTCKGIINPNAAAIKRVQLAMRTACSSRNKDGVTAGGERFCQ